MQEKGFINQKQNKQTTNQPKPPRGGKQSDSQDRARHNKARPEQDTTGEGAMNWHRTASTRRI